MRVWMCVFLIVALQPVFAEQAKPATQQTTGCDDQALKLQIAQKDEVIAVQAKEIVALNLELKMIEKAALGHDGEDAMNAANQHLQQAQEALKKLQAPKPKSK